jgi:hypothetical protein
MSIRGLLASRVDFPYVLACSRHQPTISIIETVFACDVIVN